MKTKLWFWLVIFLLFCVFLYATRAVLLPFVVALITAYFLDPVVDRLERIRLSRTWATLFVTASFFLLVGVVLVLLAPAVYNQAQAFLNAMPGYIAILNAELRPIASELLSHMDGQTLEKASSAVGNISGYAFSILGNLLGTLWNSGLALLNLLSLIFITPVVTFYLLRDWDALVERVYRFIPAHQKKNVQLQAKRIDETLSGYIRGQTNVCLLLGIFYAIGLAFVGLQFSLVIGLATGILAFIPYVGMLFGVVTGLIIAYLQFGDVQSIAMVASVFVVGQLLEGMFITPRLVGDKVGLHPVWIIFGMMAGGAMFGFVGILLAVPVTAVLGVLIRFSLERYLHSEAYLGAGKPKVKRRKKAARAA